MSKWTLFDATVPETYTFEINPDSMTSPIKTRQLRLGRSFTIGGDTRISAFQQAPQGAPWEFAGVIRSQSQHDALMTWARKSVPVVVTDHVGRSFRVVLTSFEPTERPPRPNVRWRLRYTMKTTLLEEL